MNIKISYFDNILPIAEDQITTIEIENKRCFYRTVSNFIQISNGELIEDIYIFDDKREEIKLYNKLMLVSDYFNFNLIVKKYTNQLQKLIIENTNESMLNDVTLLYKKIIKKIRKSFDNIDFPISLNDEFNLEQLIKLLKPTIQIKENLINNLYLMIDLEKAFNLNKIIIFINLKQYLAKEELIEFYKYCIYNKVNILLIENKSYQLSLENERKLIIDDDLDEFML